MFWTESGRQAREKMIFFPSRLIDVAIKQTESISKFNFAFQYKSDSLNYLGALRVLMNWVPN